MQRMVCPLSTSVLRNDIIAQALCESRPDVGSSKNRRSLGCKNKLRKGHSKVRQQTNLGREFDTDGGAFLVFNAKRSDRSVRIVSQTTHFETFLNAKVKTDQSR